MSTNGIQRIDHNRGVTVVHEETGVTGDGDTYSEALESLVQRFGATTDLAEFIENSTESVVTATDEQEAVTTIRKLRDTTALIDASRNVQRRFDEENVTEDDVEDAIKWARSQ